MSSESVNRSLSPASEFESRTSGFWECSSPTVPKYIAQIHNIPLRFEKKNRCQHLIKVWDKALDGSILIETMERFLTLLH
jgi:hypothetical protein